jgi:hypothetical protein
VTAVDGIKETLPLAHSSALAPYARVSATKAYVTCKKKKKKKKQQLPSISELIPSSNLLQQLSPIKILVKNMSYRF